MKSIIALGLLALISTNAQARSILVFKTVYSCVTAENSQESEVTLNVQEAQDGQSQMVVQFLGDSHAEAVQTKKVIPPKGMAGAPIQYKGRISGISNKEIILAVGVRPVKIGKNVGKTAALTIDSLLDRLPMVCFPAK